MLFALLFSVRMPVCGHVEGAFAAAVALVRREQSVGSGGARQGVRCRIIRAVYVHAGCYQVDARINSNIRHASQGRREPKEHHGEESEKVNEGPH